MNICYLFLDVSHDLKYETVPTTVLFRTTLTWTITQYELILQLMPAGRHLGLTVSGIYTSRSLNTNELKLAIWARKDSPAFEKWPPFTKDPETFQAHKAIEKS